ncbi:hypothetical protein CRM22_005653 [Opisthorchis felineus]|nr:hypothetical protein CRM22_005653 [Opisthorchis felineus]
MSSLNHSDKFNISRFHNTTSSTTTLLHTWRLMDIFIFITSCLFVIIAAVGLLGNLLVICVLTSTSNRLVYETFCIGLACTDFTYLVLTSPITVSQYYLTSWIFGLFWCKVFNFVVQVTVFSTAFMLLGLTTSRFLSVVLPWQNLKMTELQARLACLAAWCVGILFALPVTVVHVLVTNQLPTLTNSTSNPSENLTTSSFGGTGETTATPKQFCREQFPSQTSRMGYQLFVLLSTYVLPFVAIIIMNSMIVYKLQQKSIMERHQWAQRKEAGYPNTKSSSTSCSRGGDMIPLRSNRSSGEFSRRNNIACSGDFSQDEAPCVLNAKSPTGQDPQQSALSPIESVRMLKEEKQRRRRSKATKLVVLVTTLWCSCWLPTHIINSWFYFDEASFPFTPSMKVAKLVSQTLSFAASCVNPLVYGIMTGTFKNAISKRLIRKDREITTVGTNTQIHP